MKYVVSQPGTAGRASRLDTDVLKDKVILKTDKIILTSVIIILTFWRDSRAHLLAIVGSGCLEGVVEGSEASRRLHFGRFTTAPNMIDLTCHFSLLEHPQKSHKLSGGSGKLILSLCTLKMFPINMQ